MNKAIPRQALGFPTTNDPLINPASVSGFRYGHRLVNIWRRCTIK